MADIISFERKKPIDTDFDPVKYLDNLFLEEQDNFNREVDKADIEFHFQLIQKKSNYDYFLSKRANTDLWELGSIPYLNQVPKGFAAVKQFEDQEIAFHIEDYNKLFKKIFGHIARFEDKGYTVSCEGINKLNVDIMRFGPGTRETHIAELNVPNTVYHTKEKAFEIYRSYFKNLS